jgi:exodeoxyribonuclease-3
MGIEDHDKEGRVLALEFENFYAVCVYVPNSKPDLARLDYRQVWDRDFLEFLENLNKKKPVIFGGDFNVAHEEIDLARPKENVGEHGFTDEEREGFSNFLKSGFVDIFRELHKEPDHYTWWSYFGGARARNVGWRIDYLLVSEELKDKVSKAFILPEVMGSDHCPVGVSLEL